LILTPFLKVINYRFHAMTLATSTLIITLNISLTFFSSCCATLIPCHLPSSPQPLFLDVVEKTLSNSYFGNTHIHGTYLV